LRTQASEHRALIHFDERSTQRGCHSSNPPMSLPETIPARYTEEEAEYLSLRPVVRQTFRIAELVDMILSVTGKDAKRIAQLLRSGSVVYHGYRYWWTGFEVENGDLSTLLAAYPESDPRRTFDPAACTAAILESSGMPPRHAAEIPRATAARRRWLRFHSFWDDLAQIATTNNRPPIYREYSYARRADLYVTEVTAEIVARIVASAQKHLSRTARAQSSIPPEMARIVWVCPRTYPRS
jgi:hypothetical protein